MSQLLIPVPPLAEPTAGPRWYKPLTNKISFLSSITPVISHLSISFKILCSLGDHGHKTMMNLLAFKPAQDQGVKPVP